MKNFFNFWNFIRNRVAVPDAFGLLSLWLLFKIMDDAWLLLLDRRWLSAIFIALLIFDCDVDANAEAKLVELGCDSFRWSKDDELFAMMLSPAFPLRIKSDVGAC